MLKGFDESIVDLLGAVVGGRLVVEVDDVEGEEFLVGRPLEMGLHRRTAIEKDLDGQIDDKGELYILVLN